jgi:hypothetical protein
MPQQQGFRGACRSLTPNPFEDRHRVSLGGGRDLQAVLSTWPRQRAASAGASSSSSCLSLLTSDTPWSRTSALNQTKGAAEVSPPFVASPSGSWTSVAESVPASTSLAYRRGASCHNLVAGFVASRREGGEVEDASQPRPPFGAGAEDYMRPLTTSRTST